MLRSLLPASADFVALGAVWASGLVLLLWGRVLTQGRGLPEIQIVAGWGGLAFVLTLWGALLPQPLWWPMAAVVALMPLALVVPRLRPGREEWLALWRLMVLALPLWAIMLTAQPSQPDTFLNLLPNAAYLYDHGMLPTDVRPPAHSLLPGAPYNLQFWAYLAGAALADFPASAMAHVNVLLHLLMGLLLARVAEPLLGATFEGAERRAPGWGATALGLLLAIPLNPGFVPRIHFSAYTDAPVAISLAMAAWLVVRSLDALSKGRSPAATVWTLGLVLAALVNVKQESVAFVVALLPGIAVLALCDRRVRFWRGLATFLPAFLPAAGLYLLWRWFVFTHFADGELKLLPPEQWHWQMLPQILARIGWVITQKGFYFGMLALCPVILAVSLRRRAFGLASRLLILLIAVVLGYNAFLLAAYVAHFDAAQSVDAHSYFRYSQHFSALMLLSILAWAAETFGPQTRGRALRAAAAAATLAALALPLVLVDRLRFDLEMPQPLLRALVHDAAGFVGPTDKLAVVLPGDTETVAPMLEGVLRDTAPRRPNVDLTALQHLDGDTLPSLARKGIDKVLISCTPVETADLPAGRAVLLERAGETWRIIATWRYPAPDEARWTAILAAAPFCRSR